MMKGSKERRGDGYPSTVLGRISLGIVTGLEKAFYRYGYSIAQHPAVFMAICLTITCAFSVGLMKFTLEERPFKLWIPQDSDFIRVMEWQKENFPAQFRAHIALYEAENVLERTVLMEMLRVHEAVANATTSKATWPSVCAKLPSIPDSIFSRKKRSTRCQKHVADQEFLLGNRVKRSQDDKGIDWSTILSRGQYCGFLEDISQKCMEHSILEVWGYDRDYISTLTQEEIIEDINYVEKSVVFGFPTNFSKMLGGVERDSEGLVIRAKAARQLWVTRINLTAVKTGDFSDDSGTGMEVDTTSFGWEKELIKAVLNESERPDNISLYLMAASSFGMISGDTILGDAQYLGVGFMVVFIYIQVMLGKFNLVEQRPILSLMGLMCVGMSIFVSYGICSMFGVPFGPVNNVLPFLLLGLGIDDMFVIMQAWNNLTPREKTLTLSERIGCALKHAGVSITVTSLTDFAAFAIGSSTVLPALRSFCLFAAVGIAAVYFFQATFFVAWFSLDQRRLEDNRQGIFWCWKVKNWTPNQCSQKDLCQTFFSEFYAKYLLKGPIKIVILVVTAALLSVSAWGLSNLRQEFNPIWFLPQSSYLFKFFMKHEQYFSTDGEEGIIYFGNNNLTAELPNIEALMMRLNESEYISEVDSWYLKYKKYWEKQGYLVPDPEETEEEFLDQLSMFLHSPSGSRYRAKNFLFNSTFGCTEPATQVLASSVEYKHHIMSDSQEEIRAMDELKHIVRTSNISGYVQPFARAYSGWETNKIIERELYHNMGLAMLVVLLVTLLLIANVSASLMVLLCVVFTLVDVAALMHWWGLTIDTVSCIDLVLAIGLCVDYAAHVAHSFMIKAGSRDQRARQAVATIGPAVLNGGFSTFLAFVFLANSDSHVFSSFFKIFFGVVLYGLYHGLVFLPVLLSLVGPDAYPSAGSSPSHSPHEVEDLCPQSAQPPACIHQDYPEEVPLGSKANTTADIEQSNHCGDAGGSMESNEGAVAAKIPFEIKSSDEKFLKAATELGAIKESVLDVCHHKVILGLQKSCADLNEEDLSKVSVNLLNCQSAVENRAVFPCTSDMSLSDCTRNMDSNTWNAYHIISNRARAVCYASRQEQFGAKTQMAVNVLMHTAEEQIKSMNDLQQGQRALGDATSETLESLNQGHEHLKKQQQQLSTAHQHVHSYISLNLRELSREKKLIASGQRELALITESIKRKIEEAKKQLINQEDNQRASHELILQDLARIQDNALQIWQKLDASTHNILQAHEETVQQYGRLTEDMQRMNSTVHHLMDVLHTTKQGVEDKLSWITSLVGGTDNTIQKVYSCILHAGYFFVGMVSASFLQVPYFTRVALVVLVPLNALSEIRHDTCLQFSTLTTVMALCVIGNLIFSWLWSIFRQHKKSEYLQNGVLHQSLCCSFAEATHVSPMTQLPGKPLERTEELGDHSIKGSGNSSLSDSMALGCDFSSDEEPAPATPPSLSFLRKRMFSSLSNKGSGGSTLDAHKEEDSNEDSEPGSLTAERNKDLETSAKTLSNVRRHLLSHMNTYQPKSFHPNVSLDSRDMATSSPMRDSVLDQSSLSSRSLTPRKLCASVCKNGQLCRNNAVGDHLYCHRHVGGGSRESTPSSRRGLRRTTPLRS